MADLFFEHFIVRMEIIAEEFEKLIRFAKKFPFGHIAWLIKYRNHPMGPFLKYFNFGRKLPDLDSDYDDDVDIGLTHGEIFPIASSTPLKRICIEEIPLEEPEVFEDALEYQESK